MAEYTVFEKELSEASGVLKGVISKKRREILKGGDDYKLVKNAMAYTPDAALRLLAELGVASPANVLESAVRGLPDDSKKNAPMIAEVVRRFQPNTTVMECRLEKTAEHVVVKVRDNLMFEIGQRIPVKKTDTAIYLLDGQQPRRRGQIPGFKG